MLESGAVVVTADQARLRQVLVNLIGNAVKLTPDDGAITVSTSPCRSGDADWGEVRVSDTGPGITTAERASVFTAYCRTSGAAKVAGGGLGLAISHAPMGGTLTIEGDPGDGACFVVRLPAAGAK